MTINTHIYLGIFQESVTQLINLELVIGIIQHGGMTRHRFNHAFGEIKSFFGDRIISKGLGRPGVQT
jgi:hypothetical protein